MTHHPPSHCSHTYLSTLAGNSRDGAHLPAFFTCLKKIQMVKIFSPKIYRKTYKGVEDIAGEVVAMLLVTVDNK